MIKIYLKIKRKKYAKKIKLIVFDFDGVFTDNKVYINENGQESVCCYRSDGIGINMLQKKHIDTLVISTETNSVVAIRAKKLGIECYHGVDNKTEVLKRFISKKSYSFEEVAFVGNDINDLNCMKIVGLPVAVHDAYPIVKKTAKIILNKNGGNGAVREFCDYILSIIK